MKAKIQKYVLRKLLFRILFILAVLPLVGYAGFCGYRIYHLAQERAELKRDYSQINNIYYGLLSVDRWRNHITEIICTQIEQFQFSQQQEDTLKAEINNILNAMISQADEMINQKQKDVGGKIRKLAYNAFVDVDKIRARIPEFSQTIIDQVKRPGSMERLRFLAQNKIDEFVVQTRDSISLRAYDSLMTKYNRPEVADFNKLIGKQEAALQKETYFYAFVMLGIMLLFLLLWLVIRKVRLLYSPLFAVSVLLALILLFTGLASPMIEIDARIQELNFILIGKNIQFQDQVLFYQSKSIVDVVRILLATHKADSVFVGFLLLLFSIVFPVTKLLATNIYLLGSQSWRKSKIIKFFAFRTGKWSMADVMVVAIFMAYIGFKGILDSEVRLMNVDMNNQYVTSITTSHTSLQPGFILFIAFVLFGLILSEILKNILPEKTAVEEEVVISEGSV